MRNLLQTAIGKFRWAYPHMMQWTDPEVFAAMLLAASKQPGSRIKVIGQNDNGELRYQIGLGPDTSDGLG